MLQSRLNIRKTHEIANPHAYIRALKEEYKDWAYDETKAAEFKGKWRTEVFKKAEDSPLDLEIGTGNGFFFAHRALQERGRSLIGIELKFKPLIQSIRRALFNNSKNMRMVRYHARFIGNLFEKEELDHIFIHHPDPWTRRKKHKHRLVRAEFLDELWCLQKPGSFVEFKTDSLEYFLFAQEEAKKTKYTVERHTLDLHKSKWAEENFETHFERLFKSKGVPINYMLLRK